MDSKELKGLCEAYSAIYDDKIESELDEMFNDFEGIENLTDEQIDSIVEETIDEMLSEGYEFDEVEEIFEEVLSEARIDMSARAAARKQYAAASEKSAKEARGRAASKERAEKRAAAVSKVKGAVKSALGRAKAAVKSGVAKAKEAGKEAKFRVVDKPAAAYATKRNLHPAAGMAARSKDPEKRRGLRAKVAADIKGRIKHKIAKAQVGAYSAARKAGQAASDVAGRAKQSAKYTAARTKRGVKKAVGAAASGVASGASKLATRMATEEVDVYDLVLAYLLDEGYAETEDDALVIMANLTEEEILEYRKLAAGLVGGMMALNMMKPGMPAPKIKTPTPEREKTELPSQRSAENSRRMASKLKAEYDADQAKKDSSKKRDRSVRDEFYRSRGVDTSAFDNR